MKAFAKLLTICLLVTILAGCGTQATVAPEATKVSEAPQATAVPELTAAEQWAKANGLGPYTPAEEDWAAIEEAAKKEGKVTVYANSSKIEKLLDMILAFKIELFDELHRRFGERTVGRLAPTAGPERADDIPDRARRRRLAHRRKSFGDAWRSSAIAPGACRRGRR